MSGLDLHTNDRRPYVPLSINPEVENRTAATERRSNNNTTQQYPATDLVTNFKSIFSYFIPHTDEFIDASRFSGNVD